MRLQNVIHSSEANMQKQYKTDIKCKTERRWGNVKSEMDRAGWLDQGIP
jgi:hypothetical protein